MKYQVGDLINFRENDPQFNTLEDALLYAEEESMSFDEEYIGIWDEEFDLVAIYHQGRSYTP